MSEHRFKLLAIDDDAQTLELLRDTLADVEELSILKATNAEEGIRKFREQRPNIVLVDMYMPDRTGMEVVEELAEFDPGSELVLMTGQFTEELAVEAVRKGAADCLAKPLDMHALRTGIRNFLGAARVRAEAARLDEQALRTFQIEGMIGRSPQMLDLFAKVRRIAPHYRTVLVTGPTGTGKELVARTIQRLSPVSANALMVCNCAALVETLIESELFGYVKGAFTGATQDKAGLFEHANNSTVFLDEIGDMPLAAQAKLLRVLQNQEVQRVGSPVTRKIDVRVIAATHRDLRQNVRDGTFREDLFYRLSMVEIKIPALRERIEDLPLLQRHFVGQFARQYGKQISGITRRAQAVLARYGWPGNVRELENTIGHGCMMTDSTVVDVKDLPPYLSQSDATRREEVSEPLLTMDEMQNRYVLQVLDRVGGDKSTAARVLGIGRATLYNILNRMEPKSKD